MFRTPFVFAAILITLGCSDDDPNPITDGGGDGSADASTDSTVGPDASDDATVSEDAVVADAPSGDATVDGGSNCSGAIGANDGAETLGATVYSSGETVVVSDVIFDASTGDALVTVTGAGTNVIFERVTFRGTTIGDKGHTLEVASQGSVEIRNSVFEGTPKEDHIHFFGHDPSSIDCTLFTKKPGGAHIVVDSGGEVTVTNSIFSAGGAIENRNDVGYVELTNNMDIDTALFDEGTTGIITGSTITGRLKLHLAVNALIEGNTISIVEHGDASSENDPIDTYFLNNIIASAENNGGSCYAVGNSGNEPVPFCMQEAAPWF